MLFKACVLLDQFSDKLCKSVLSRVEAGLEMQTNVHLDIQVGEYSHAFPGIPADLSQMAPYTSIENQNLYSRANSETGTIQEDFPALAFINLGLQLP